MLVDAIGELVLLDGLQLLLVLFLTAQDVHQVEVILQLGLHPFEYARYLLLLAQRRRDRHHLKLAVLLLLLVFFPILFVQLENFYYTPNKPDQKYY